MPEETQWVTLHNPSQGAWHRVPDNPAVIQDFQDRGWETPDESAARAEREAIDLRGAELEEALKEAGLSTSGKVAEKQQRLADFRSEQAPAVDPTEPFDPLTEQDATTEENEGEQV